MEENKGQHPITYEHVGIVVGIAIGVFIFISACLQWQEWAEPKIIIPPEPTREFLEAINREDMGLEVKSIYCYNAKGEGPMHECPAIIECHNEVGSNKNSSKIPCPVDWPENFPGSNVRGNH